MEALISNFIASDLQDNSRNEYLDFFREVYGGYFNEPVASALLSRAHRGVRYYEQSKLLVAAITERDRITMIGAKILDLNPTDIPGIVQSFRDSLKASWATVAEEALGVQALCKFVGMRRVDNPDRAKELLLPFNVQVEPRIEITSGGLIAISTAAGLSEGYRQQLWMWED